MINPARAARGWRKMHVAGYQMHGIVRSVAGCDVVVWRYQVVFLNILFLFFSGAGEIPAGAQARVGSAGQENSEARDRSCMAARWRHKMRIAS